MRTHENPWRPKIIYNWWLLRSPYISLLDGYVQGRVLVQGLASIFLPKPSVDLANCYCVIGRGSHIYSMIYEM